MQVKRGGNGQVARMQGQSTTNSENIKFVKLIQDRECLYDYTNQDYIDKEKQEQAWAEVAAQMNEKGKIHVILMFDVSKNMKKQKN